VGLFGLTDYSSTTRGKKRYLIDHGQKRKKKHSGQRVYPHEKITQQGGTGGGEQIAAIPKKNRVPAYGRLIIP